MTKDEEAAQLDARWPGVVMAETDGPELLQFLSSNALYPEWLNHFNSCRFEVHHGARTSTPIKSGFLDMDGTEEEIVLRVVRATVKTWVPRRHA